MTRPIANILVFWSVRHRQNVRRYALRKCRVKIVNQTVTLTERLIGIGILFTTCAGILYVSAVSVCMSRRQRPQLNRAIVNAIERCFHLYCFAMIDAPVQQVGYRPQASRITYLLD